MITEVVLSEVKGYASAIAATFSNGNLTGKAISKFPSLSDGVSFKEARII